MTHDDEWDDDDEWVDDEGDPEDDLLACPSCRRQVHEDAQQCPHCGDWIIPMETEGRWKRNLWIAVAILVILAMGLPAVM